MTATQTRPPFLDGGVVLVAKPYTDAQWSTVRKAWWWHFAGMVFLAPFYSLVALTIWQEPSRQTFGRRLLWATAVALLAVIVVGVPLLVIFSRRWYWLWRTKSDPVESGIATDPSPPPSGILAWIATMGSDLADNITGRSSLDRRATVGLRPSTTQRFEEPWATLVTQAAVARDRIRVAAVHVRGPATDAVTAARAEAAAGAAAAAQVAEHAGRITAVLQSLDTESVRSRIATLDAEDQTSDDLDAAKAALSEQLASAERLEQSRVSLRHQLERLVAQLGEAAARTEALAVGGVHGRHGPDLDSTVDRLAAMRTALEVVTAPGPQQN